MARKKVLYRNLPPETLKRSSVALEDLLFALKKFDPDQLGVALQVLRRAVDDADSGAGIGEFQSPNPNKHFLIGALPRLLLDRRLFPSNDDIAIFSKEALRFEIARHEKLARQDLIGRIVCRADKLHDEGLTTLVTALEGLVNDQDQIDAVIAQKRSGSFSWNEAIQNLLQDS